MTAVITALAALTRFLNLGSPTDAGTPIFDEKHYAPQAWQMLHNHGVEDNPGYGLVVHPPVGKQLIALGEAIFGYNGVGWRFTGAVLGVITDRAGGAHRPADEPVDDGRRNRRAAAHRRRGQLRRVAHRAARRLPGVLRGGGVRRVDRGPRPGAGADACRTARGPHRRNPVGPAAGRAVVALRRGCSARIGLCDKVVRAVLRGVLRVDDVGVRRRRAQAVPGAAAVAGHAAARPGPGGLCAGADSVRCVSGVIRAVVRVGNRDQPPRGWPVDRPRWFPAGRNPIAVALHLRGVPVSLRSDQRRRQPSPVGVEAVDVADVAAPGALCDRPGERSRAAGRSRV